MSNARCGTCGAMLYTNGTCPNCDRAPRIAPEPDWTSLVQLDAELALIGAADSLALVGYRGDDDKCSGCGSDPCTGSTPQC